MRAKGFDVVSGVAPATMCQQSREALGVKDQQCGVFPRKPKEVEMPTPAAGSGLVSASTSDVPQWSEAEQRKRKPLFSGVLRYFPDALLEVAELSRIGNDQHNPGQPLHWSKGKSNDHEDALMRHLVDAGTRDTDNVRHRTKVAWRALAALQMEIERERALPRVPPLPSLGGLIIAAQEAQAKADYDKLTSPAAAGQSWNYGDSEPRYSETIADTEWSSAARPAPVDRDDTH